MLEAAAKRNIFIISIPRRMKIAFGNSEFDVSRYLVPANPGTRININVTMNSIEFALTKEYREALSPWQVLPQPTSRCTNCGWVTRAGTEMESMAMLEDSGIQHDLELPESDSEYDTYCEEERDLLAVTPASLSDVGEVVGHMFQDDTPLANQPGLPMFFLLQWEFLLACYLSLHQFMWLLSLLSSLFLHPLVCQVMGMLAEVVVVAHLA